jgi:hypothetical protein
MNYGLNWLRVKTGNRVSYVLETAVLAYMLFAPNRDTTIGRLIEMSLAVLVIATVYFGNE